MTVVDLAPGERACIVAVEGVGSFRRRLLELGLLPGVLIQRAVEGGRGDPFSVLVRGTRLSLRHADASHLRVERAR